MKNDKNNKRNNKSVKECPKNRQNETFYIVNDWDGNDSFEIEAANSNDAAHEALKELGWWVAK